MTTCLKTTFPWPVVPEERIPTVLQNVLVQHLLQSTLFFCHPVPATVPSLSSLVWQPTSPVQCICMDHMCLYAKCVGIQTGFPGSLLSRQVMPPFQKTFIPFLCLSYLPLFICFQCFLLPPCFVSLEHQLESS